MIAWTGEHYHSDKIRQTTHTGLGMIIDKTADVITQNLQTTCNDYFNKSAHGYLTHEYAHIMSCIYHFLYPIFFQLGKKK